MGLIYYHNIVQKIKTYWKESKYRFLLTIFFSFFIASCILCITLFLLISQGVYQYGPYSGFRYYNFSPVILEDELKSSNYREQLPKKPNVPYRIAIIFNAYGDHLTTMRIQQAADNLGWESLAIALHEDNPMDIVRTHGLITRFSPDFTISFFNSGKFIGTKNYFIWHYPCSDDKTTHKIQCAAPISNYDGLLSVANIEKVYKHYGNITIPIVDFKFSRPETEFRKINYSNLFMCGANMDKTRSGSNYQKLYKLLDKRTDVNIYGRSDAWKHLNSYRGFIPYDDKKFVDAMRKNGIVLVLHSGGHIKGNFPSARTLEAISASALVIADEMPWVKETFGDNVLYIETINKSAEEIYTQIDKHLEWIKLYPEEAYIKAKNAYKIYLNKFTMEKILHNIADMHEKIINKT